MNGSDPTVLDDDALGVLARQLGQDPAVLRAALLAAKSAPLVRDHIESYLGVQGERTRATYSTPLYRIRDGVGPVCDQTCEPCLKPGFVCLVSLCGVPLESREPARPRRRDGVGGRLQRGHRPQGCGDRSAARHQEGSRRQPSACHPRAGRQER